MQKAENITWDFSKQIGLSDLLILATKRKVPSLFSFSLLQLKWRITKTKNVSETLSEQTEKQ